MTMRLHLSLICGLFLAACASAPPPAAANAEADSAVEFLLTSAATDFHSHGPAAPLRFRNVGSGYVKSDDGLTHYKLCGEFSSRDGPWTRFATLKTSGYEQWIGGQADAYCDSRMVWINRDLAVQLQKRFDSMR